jgi:prevent-host-death family protein
VKEFVQQRTVMYDLIMLTMTVTEARARLREALERVRNGEDIELSQNGQVVAVIVHPDKLRTPVRTPNTLAAQDRLERLRTMRGAHPTRAEISAARADAMVNELRERRDEDWE